MSHLEARHLCPPPTGDRAERSIGHLGKAASNLQACTGREGDVRFSSDFQCKPNPRERLFFLFWRLSKWRGIPSLPWQIQPQRQSGSFPSLTLEDGRLPIPRPLDKGTGRMFLTCQWGECICGSLPTHLRTSNPLPPSLTPEDSKQLWKTPLVNSPFLLQISISWILSLYIALSALKLAHRGLSAVNRTRTRKQGQANNIWSPFGLVWGALLS